MQKLLTFFSAKILAYMPYLICNDTLTNDIVNFEQLGPDLHNIKAHTKFGGTPLIFTQGIFQKRKYG